MSPKLKRINSMRMDMWHKLNKIIKRHSREASLVILNMPEPMKEQKPLHFVSHLEVLSEGLSSVLFCHGTGREIIAAEN